MFIKLKMIYLQEYFKLNFINIVVIRTLTMVVLQLNQVENYLLSICAANYGYLHILKYKVSLLTYYLLQLIIEILGWIKLFLILQLVGLMKIIVVLIHLRI